VFTIITAGIDMGIESVKVIIMQNGKIIGRGKGRSGGAKRLSAAEAALQDALQYAGLSAEKITKTIATGKGKFDLPFVDDCYTEPITAAKAVEFLCPGTTCVVDVGADETMVLTLDKEARIQEMVINEKCAAGVGSFIRNMARRLELTLEEMSALPHIATDSATVSDGCVVFAELDALSLLNRGVPPKEIAMAITTTAAVRSCTVINDITVPALDSVVLLGGLTKNAAFVRALKAISGIDFVIPDEAEYAGALGAALLAAGWGAHHFIEV
jgi:benzoyl-CoA reductase subunit D